MAPLPQTAGFSNPTLEEAERVYYGSERYLNGMSIGSPRTLPRSPGTVWSRERGRAISCGKMSGVSTYGLITGPSEVQSTDDVIYPLWPYGLGSLWGKGVGEEGLEVRESGKTDTNRNPSSGRLDCGQGRLQEAGRRRGFSGRCRG